MKKTFLTVLLFYIFTGIAVAQNLSKTTEYKILLTGASFASPQNGWFEIGCRKLNAEAINRAIGGEAIANTANRMANGTLYSKEELENIDALVIMQVHNKDVYEELQLKDKYTDYEVPFDRSNYAAAYDYVIKRYLTECYELRNDTTSKYYNTPYHFQNSQYVLDYHLKTLFLFLYPERQYLILLSLLHLKYSIFSQNYPRRSQNIPLKELLQMLNTL